VIFNKKSLPYVIIPCMY